MYESKLSSDESAIQTLTHLGLTILGARIYLALCKYDSLTTKELSRIAKTAQPDTYRVIANLQKKGLVEKIIQNPAKFKAVPFHKGANLLLERKRAEYKNLGTEIKHLRRKFKKRNLNKSFETQDSHFALIPKRETVVARIREAIDKSRESVDILLSWKRFEVGITSEFADAAEKAWGRGVRFRIVVEYPEEETDKEKALDFCGKSLLCNVRFLRDHPKTVLGIYDQTEVFVIVAPKEGLFDSPALWSNNQSLISVIHDYFEILWLTAMEEPKP